jgi:hypothetical protein
MKKLYFLLSLLLFCNLISKAQDTLPKLNHVSTGLSLSISFYTPALAYTPYINVKLNKHETFAGLDIYDNVFFNFYGVQAGYKFYILPTQKTFNLYLVSNLQYVQYAIGSVYNVPYYYLPTNFYERDFNLIQIKSFNNTFGFGLNVNFLKYFTTYLEYSIGYNFSINKYSPTNDNLQWDHLVGKKINYTPFIKFGLSAKIFRW